LPAGGRRGGWGDSRSLRQLGGEKNFLQEPVGKKDVSEEREEKRISSQQKLLEEGPVKTKGRN